MKFIVKIDDKIIGEFDIMRESLGDFLKRKKLKSDFKINIKSSIILLSTIKNDTQLKLGLKN